MPRPAPGDILRAVCRAAEDLPLAGCPDHDLLGRFTAARDEAAFHALLRRHGPMVLAVCRSVLPAEADAEDAFQATFLVLAHKADSIRRAAALASWLHGVALRTARRTRDEFARRRTHECRAAVGPAAPP